MSKTLALLALLVASTAAHWSFPGASIAGRVMGSSPLSSVVDAASGVVRLVKNTAAGIKKPIDQTVTFFGSSLCKKVKSLLGVQFEQLSSKVEPDLNLLSLKMDSDGVKASFKLDSVAKALPNAVAYNPDQPLIIFMHGFIDDPTLFAFPIINEAFQTIGNNNVLGLDASPLIRFFYLRASTLVRSIGEKLGSSLADMVNAGLDPEDIHLVGHSLGSMIAGFAGKSFQNLTGMKIGRITGLDPAGPCFSHVDDDLRIQATDAEFVDVIHTNGGVFGLKDAVGQVDYFPNGGEQQPNCILQFCSHLRVVELFAESVRSPALFRAKRCNSWEKFLKEECSKETSLMGYGSKPGTSGLFYLRTAEASPYALGAPGLRARGKPRGGLNGLRGVFRFIS